MPLYEVSMEPLDPLLFGDNRSARAGIDHVQLDQDPSPLTLHGAIGRYLADRSGAWPTTLLGEWQKDILNPRGKVGELLGYCLLGAGGGRHFPAPRHLRCTIKRRRGEVVVAAADLLAPRLAPGAASGAPWERFLLGAEDEPLENEAEAEVLLSESGISDVLCGDLPRGRLELATTLVRAEPRPGIAVDNETGTVVEGQLFTRPYRRYEPAGLTAAAGMPAGGYTAWFATLEPLELDCSDPIGFLGGDRRRARFELREAGPVALRSLCERVVAAAGAAESNGFFLSLLTPALQAPVPVQVEGRTPIAAALGKPVYSSGWDVEKNQPRPLRALIPAGSVFFFEWPKGISSGAPRAELVRALWLHPLRDEGAAAGFGRCLPGIWR